jgi:hypothetical protein
MLFVGGTQDGRNHKIAPVERYMFYIPYWDKTTAHARFGITHTGSTKLSIETYTRRTYTNNERDRSFVVMALESMSGDEVMHSLATGYYENNPLKWANSTDRRY